MIMNAKEKEIQRLIRQARKGGASSENAVDRLARLGDAVIEPVLAALEGSDEPSSLGDVVVRGATSEAVPRLLASMNTESTDLFLAIIRALERLKDPRSVAPLVSILDNAERYETDRALAARALGSIGAMEALPRIISTAHSTIQAEMPRIALECAIAAARLGDHGLSQLPQRLMDDSDPVVRADAAKAMQSSLGPGTFASLRKAMGDEFDETRRNAIDALFLIGARECMELIAVHLTDPDSGTAQLARHRLEQLTGDPFDAIGAFESWMGRKEASLPKDAVFRLGAKRSLGALENLLRKKTELATVFFELATLYGQSFDVVPGQPHPKSAVPAAKRWIRENDTSFEAGALYRYGTRLDLLPILGPG